MQKQLLLQAFKDYSNKNTVDANKKLLEYKNNVNDDYSLLFNMADKYSLEYLLFSVDVLFELKLNEFLKPPVAVSIYNDLCSYMDDYNYDRLFDDQRAAIQELRYNVLQN